MLARSALRSVEEDPDTVHCVVVVKICLKVCGDTQRRPWGKEQEVRVNTEANHGEQLLIFGFQKVCSFCEVGIHSWVPNSHTFCN